jgi:Bacterial Ig domain/Dockerin type I domain
VSYAYDGSGNLTMVRNLSQGVSQRYGYDAEHRLTLASGLGQLGESVVYGSGAPQVNSILSDFGGVYQFTAAGPVSGFLSAGGSARYTFSLRDSEIQSTATDFVLVGVDVSGGALPGIQGLSPLVSRVSGTDAYGLFAVERGGLSLLEVSGAAGGYRIDLSVAGDLNRDGLVDGLDSQLLTLALNSRAGEAGYQTSYDLNRDFAIDGKDVQILGSNYGFIANRPPVVTPSAILTHKDLETRVELGDRVTDPEGDAVFYQLLNPVNGSMQVSSDGEGVVFVPTPGYVGPASFDLIADDGFSSSAPTTIALNVSGAELINLDFVLRGIRLKANEQSELRVVGDFADQKGVLLPDSYLTYGSDRTTIAAVDSNGVVAGLTDGVSVLSAAHGNIQAVTALRVGKQATPSTDTELNIALAENYGLNLYPLAITLPEGVDRKLVIGIFGLPELPNQAAASNGTRYFVSNPDVIQVNSDGIVTGLHNGFANITVVYGGAEGVIPVHIEAPHIGPTVLDKTGGIVQGTDGSLVMLGQGALSKETEVNITKLQRQDLTVPFPEEKYSFEGAFYLNIGDDGLNIPVQLAIPAPEGLAVGTEVFFMREGIFPDDAGNPRSIWIMEESGRVGADGMIRTQSPPWQGAFYSGKYSIAVPKFNYVVSKYNPNVTLGGVLDTAGSLLKSTGKAASALIFTGGVATTVAPEGAAAAVAARTVTAGALATSAGAVTATAGATAAATLTLSQGLLVFGGGYALGAAIYDAFLAETDTFTVPSVDVITVPVIGLPYHTSLGVQINPGQIPVVTAPITVSNGPTQNPVIRGVELFYEMVGGLVEPVISLTGSNFATTPEDFNNLTVEMVTPNGKVYELTKVIELSKVETPDKQTIVVKPSREDFLRSPNQIRIRRTIKLPQGTYSLSKGAKTEVEYESDPVKVPVNTCVALAVEALASEDMLAITNTNNPLSVIQETGGNKDLLQTLIQVGMPGRDDRPTFVAITQDAVAAYVSLSNSGRVAGVDLLTRQQINTHGSQDPNLLGSDPTIYLGSDARPGAIVIGAGDKYAYVADGNSFGGKGRIFVIDIDPNSGTYNQKVGNPIELDGCTTGIARMALSSDGRRLFATSKGSSTENGEIFVVNVDLNDQTKGHKAKWHERIATIEGGKGTFGISAVPFDSTKMLFTNRYEDSKGFGVLTILSDDALNFSTTTSYTPLQLGSSNDEFDVNTAVDVTITHDGKYAFVAGMNTYGLGSGIPSIDGATAGSNIGIIKDPLSDR